MIVCATEPVDGACPVVPGTRYQVFARVMLCAWGGNRSLTRRSRNQTGLVFDAETRRRGESEGFTAEARRRREERSIRLSLLSTHVLFPGFGQQRGQRNAPSPSCWRRPEVGVNFGVQPGAHEHGRICTWSIILLPERQEFNSVGTDGRGSDSSANPRVCGPASPRRSSRRRPGWL